MWNANYQRERRLKNVSLAVEFLGGACARCGKCDQDELEFDHCDPKLKTKNASEIMRWNWERIRLFLIRERIQLLCRSCHLLKSLAEA